MEKKRKIVDETVTETSILDVPVSCICIISNFFSSGVDVSTMLRTCKHFYELFQNPSFMGSENAEFNFPPKSVKMKDVKGPLFYVRNAVYFKETRRKDKFFELVPNVTKLCIDNPKDKSNILGDDRILAGLSKLQFLRCLDLNFGKKVPGMDLAQVLVNIKEFSFRYYGSLTKLFEQTSTARYRTRSNDTPKTTIQRFLSALVDLRVLKVVIGSRMIGTVPIIKLDDHLFWKSAKLEKLDISICEPPVKLISLSKWYPNLQVLRFHFATRITNDDDDDDEGGVFSALHNLRSVELSPWKQHYNCDLVESVIAGKVPMSLRFVKLCCSFHEVAPPAPAPGGSNGGNWSNKWKIEMRRDIRYAGNMVKRNVSCIRCNGKCVKCGFEASKFSFGRGQRRVRHCGNCTRAFCETCDPKFEKKKCEKCSYKSKMCSQCLESGCGNRRSFKTCLYCETDRRNPFKELCQECYGSGDDDFCEFHLIEWEISKGLRSR